MDRDKEGKRRLWNAPLWWKRREGGNEREDELERKRIKLGSVTHGLPLPGEGIAVDSD